MKLKLLKIQNYRSCESVTIQFDSLHALVGANGAGKSTILRAMDFLFNPAKGKIDEEAFWNGQTDRTIWIEAIFGDLSASELADRALLPFLKPDKTLHIARSAKFVTAKDTDGDSPDDDIVISQHYCVPLPPQPWLQDSQINGKTIAEWWSNKDSLVVDGASFAAFIGGNTKPQVGAWKEKAAEFAIKHIRPESFTEAWSDNPQGYAGVLKGTLPHFVFVPAIRDVVDEAKVTKTNPFGRILYEIVNSISEEQRGELEGSLVKLQQRLNRAGGKERLKSIVDTELRLNEVLGDYMQCDLEIEFQPPTMETVLTTPVIFANDGYRNIVSNKGHGLQRAIIFSILRCYSERITGTGAAKKKSMIFAVEEPELYMHPMAQRTIRRVFQGIAGGGDQVVFSTHSSLLVDVAFFDEIIRVESVPRDVEGKKTLSAKVWQLTMHHMIEDLLCRVPKANPTPESMRALYAHAYHPNRSEGFFAKKIILVEGATEQYALPIYARGVNMLLDAMNISIVDCGGKGQMDRLFRVFNELGIPCYMLFDYDKNNDEKAIIAKSRELLTLAGVAPDEPKAVLIEDRCACFPNKWEDTVESEVDCKQLNAEGKSVFGFSKDSSKPLIARYVATQLTGQKPPIVPQSIAAILQRAAQVSWAKSCLHQRPPPGK